jgi:hypothetical protein
MTRFCAIIPIIKKGTGIPGCQTSRGLPPQGVYHLKGFTTSMGLPPQGFYHLKGFTTVAELGSFARIAHVLRQVC